MTRSHLLLSSCHLSIQPPEHISGASVHIGKIECSIHLRATKLGSIVPSESDDKGMADGSIYEALTDGRKGFKDYSVVKGLGMVN